MLDVFNLIFGSDKKVIYRNFFLAGYCGPEYSTTAYYSSNCYHVKTAQFFLDCLSYLQHLPTCSFPTTSAYVFPVATCINTWAFAIFSLHSQRLGPMVALLPPYLIIYFFVLIYTVTSFSSSSVRRYVCFTFRGLLHAMFFYLWHR